MKRGEPWGIFTISPIYREGVHVAWEALCRCRNNAGDKLGSTCKKSVARTSLTDAEARLRLKCWLVAGLDDKEWLENNKRNCHLSMGGPLLGHSANGLSEAELDVKAGTGR